MSFDFNSLKNMISSEMPRWPASHRSMNPDDDFDESVAANPVMPDFDGRLPTALDLTEPVPIGDGPKSNLDLINECDSFPHYQTNADLFFAHTNTYYALYVKGYPDDELGYILPSVANVLKGLPDWTLDEDERSLTLDGGSNEQERSKIVASTTKAMAATGHFKVLDKWRDELYPVYGPKGVLLFNIERAATALFGVVTYGCHLTAYTKSKGSDGKEEVKLWVARRSANKQTYPGMLDNTVAGGIASGESPFESLVRECAEEAGLSEDIVRSGAKATGIVSYFHIRDHRAGGETRLLQPEVQYVYDLELAEDVIPKPADDEVEGFELQTIPEIKKALRDGEFKPNCALVLLDFFVRHGFLSYEDDENYTEIVSRLHRKLEFPLPGVGPARNLETNAA
jgi:8-oxo-dGTP pyrophosphatase MutT (NUDIX family)